MSDVFDDRIYTNIPADLRREIPVDLPQRVELLGRGNNAVVLRHPDGGDAIKLYGHDRLLTDVNIDQRIARHFASEIIALTKIVGFENVSVPVLQDYGRLHPSASTEEEWHIRSVFGWIRMSYLEGERQDVLAVNHLGLKFKEEERNDPFYFSIGYALGQLHQAGRTIVPGEILHDVYEEERTLIKLFSDLERAKWEIGGHTIDEMRPQEAALSQKLDEFEASYERIASLKDEYTFVHGDFAARNLLYRREADQILASAILDFGEAGMAVPERDFIPMSLGERPAAIEGYRAAGGIFSPERFALVSQHDQIIGRITASRKPGSHRIQL